MKDPQQIEKAFDAMKALGISHESVGPVLKRLYKLYDKNWSFIEAENYRALVDAVFEEQQEIEMKRKKPVDSELSEPPFKKLRGGSEEDDASSTLDSTGPTGMRVSHKKGETGSLSLSSRKQETSGLNRVKVKTEPGSCSAIHKGKDKLLSAASTKSDPGSCSAVHKGKDKLLSAAKPTKSDSVSITLEKTASSSGSKCRTNVIDSRTVDIKKLPDRCRSKKVTAVALDSTSKISAPSDLVDASSTRNISAKSSRCLDPQKVKECASASNSVKSECKLDIVSSKSGDVKLCCVSALGNTTSHTPDDTDSVLKSVEEKFLRTHKVTGPPFSLKNLLEDLCNSFFELAKDTVKKSLVRTASREVISQDRKKLLGEKAIEHLKVSDEKKLEPGTSQVVREGKTRQPRFLIDDIAKGEEPVQISLLDNYVISQPPKFFYIPKNIIYQKAIVNISLARISEEDCCSSCSGDCLSSSVPCACTRATNGEFAYTKDGRLKLDFLKSCLSDNRHEVYCRDCPIERAKNQKKPEKCKGHTLRKFIKECWSKCGCNMQCGNRVVQRGITRKLQVFWTASGKGWGLRTLENLPKGTFVCEYVGEVVTNTELDERNRLSKGNERHTYPVHLDADWTSESILDDDHALCLDATNYGNVARFINHKCGVANLLDIPVEVETVDHHYYHVAFFTTREVKAYEELSWDYGIDFDDVDHPIKAFRCCCGSTHCRDKSRKGSKSKAKVSAR